MKVILTDYSVYSMTRDLSDRSNIYGHCEAAEMLLAVGYTVIEVSQMLGVWPSWIEGVKYWMRKANGEVT